MAEEKNTEKRLKDTINSRLDDLKEDAYYIKGQLSALDYLAHWVEGDVFLRNPDEVIQDAFERRKIAEDAFMAYKRGETPVYTIRLDIQAGVSGLEAAAYKVPMQTIYNMEGILDILARISEVSSDGVVDKAKLTNLRRGVILSGNSVMGQVRFFEEAANNFEVIANLPKEKEKAMFEEALLDSLLLAAIKDEDKNSQESTSSRDSKHFVDGENYTLALKKARWQGRRVAVEDLAKVLDGDKVRE